MVRRCESVSVAARGEVHEKVLVVMSSVWDGPSRFQARGAIIISGVAV